MDIHALIHSTSKTPLVDEQDITVKVRDAYSSAYSAAFSMMMMMMIVVMICVLALESFI